jgi:hypothetical protein
VGIRNRVEDAEILWREGEAALLMALVAASATARRKYPECKKDREGFERLLLDARGWRLSLEFRGEQVPKRAAVEVVPLRTGPRSRIAGRHHLDAR